MKNMELVMNALAVFLNNPKNAASALIELMEMIEKYGEEAVKELEHWKQEYDYLDSENLQLRQMLKQAGIQFRSGGEAA